MFLIFWLFFGIFRYASSRNGTERNDNFYFRLFSEFSILKAWSEAIMVSFNFLNFFATFLKFSITCRVGMERKNNFYFLSFTASSNIFWLEMKPQWYFWIFLEFSITHRVGTKRIDNFYFLSFPSFSILFWLKMKPQWYFLIFWIFLPFFGIFYHASSKNGTKG